MAKRRVGSADLLKSLSSSRLSNEDIHLDNLDTLQSSSDPLLKPTRELVTIVVWHFEATPDSPLLANDDVTHLVVQYRFLDVPPTETETPYSVRRPGCAGKPAAFDFFKVFQVTDDNTSFQCLLRALPRPAPLGVRRRAEARRTPGPPRARPTLTDSVHYVRFLVLSEPDDMATADECTPVGVAYVSLTGLWEDQCDVVEENIPVTAFDDVTQLVGHLNVTVKMLRALAQAADSSATCRQPDTQADE